mmetsp:Transcript_18834/g.33640  ORF Transcript_18834/g.33640 Transcript_18834/m.33640 type:complete len:233 (-) Transcript_18834:1824-2522(-)
MRTQSLKYCRWCRPTAHGETCSCLGSSFSIERFRKAGSPARLLPPVTTLRREREALLVVPAALMSCPSKLPIFVEYLQTSSKGIEPCCRRTRKTTSTTRCLDRTRENAQSGRGRGSGRPCPPTLRNMRPIPTGMAAGRVPAEWMTMREGGRHPSVLNAAKSMTVHGLKVVRRNVNRHVCVGCARNLPTAWRSACSAVTVPRFKLSIVACARRSTNGSLKRVTSWSRCFLVDG